MRANEFLIEYRDRLLQYVKSLLPTWPEYVLKDWLVPNKGNFSNLPADAVKNGIIEKVQGAGLTINTKWQLIPDMKFTMDMFDPKTKQLLIGRAGGSSDLGMGVPKDKERHATQAALAQQQGGVRREPVILVKRPDGYDLLEGWHRTIQHFHKYPDGYTGPAYVAVEQGPQGVAEGESNDTAISLSKLGKFHPGADTLAEFVPERATAQYALHPDKWESTFYSLTNKDSDKLKYYGPKKISIPPGTLVGDMAIANKFYRAKTPEEQEQYAELYKASLQPYPVDVSEYRMPELLIPKQGVAENFADGKNPGRKGLSKRVGIPKKATLGQLEKIAGSSTGERRRMAQWQLNMRRGKKK